MALIAEVQQLKAMFKDLLEIPEAEPNKPVDEACSPMPSHKEIRRHSRRLTPTPAAMP